MTTPLVARILVKEGERPAADVVGKLVCGTRRGCDVVLNDPVVAERHCEFFFSGRFYVRDLGSVTGTWINGMAAPTGPSVLKGEAEQEVRNGSEIVIGVSRLVARVEEQDGASTLFLELERNVFYFTEPRKGVFDSDPDLWVYDEVHLARFPALRLGNRVAAGVALVLLSAAILSSSVGEVLADAGPLLAAHAAVREGTHAMAEARLLIPGFEPCAKRADEQGCGVCHEGKSVPDAKCMQCHMDLAAEGTRRHPYLVDGVIGDQPGMASGAGRCISCHVDHEAPLLLKKGVQGLVGNCTKCHSEPPAVPERPKGDKRERPYSTLRFPHGLHVDRGIKCDACHHQLEPEVRALRSRGLDDQKRDDFAEVPFETCAVCHVKDAPGIPWLISEQRDDWRVREPWTVRWHGTDDAAQTCGLCHEDRERGGKHVFGPELRRIERFALTPEEQAACRGKYVRERRSHASEFVAHAGDQACTDCHKSGRLASEAKTEWTFWHARHLKPGGLSPTAPQRRQASEECLSCHDERRNSSGLVEAKRGGFVWPAEEGALAKCAPCHKEGEGLPISLRARTALELSEQQRVLATDFPHKYHLDFRSDGPLADGCFTCHEFVRPSGGEPFSFVPRTAPWVQTCLPCHDRHQNVGGNACQQCHPSEGGSSNVYLLSANVAVGEQVGGRLVPAPPERPWPELNAFSHISPGHNGVSSPELDTVSCEQCHDADTTALAPGIADVPVPDECEPTCVHCHLEKRFHWR